MKNKYKEIQARIIRIAMLTFKKAMDPYFAGNSAEIAFFLLMSIAPAVLIIAELANLFGRSMDVITVLIDEYASEDLAGMLEPLLDKGGSGALSALLIVLALWSGSKAIFALMRITNYAYLGGTSAKNPLIGFIRERVRAIVTIFIITFTIIFAISILMYGKVIFEAVTTYLNEMLDRDIDIAEAWLHIRWILGFILYFFMVVSIYYLLPSSANRYSNLISRNNIPMTIKRIFMAWVQNSKNTIKKIFPGSVFASIGMMIATGAYSLYLGNISAYRFNILFGSLGAAVLLLLWFYILAYVLVLGIQINSIWEESKHTEEVPDKYDEKMED